MGSNRLDAAEELSKSLAKNLMSEKYNDFTFEDCKFILEMAALIASKIIEEESKVYNSIKVQPEDRRGENQN